MPQRARPAHPGEGTCFSGGPWPAETDRLGTRGPERSFSTKNIATQQPEQ